MGTFCVYTFQFCFYTPFPFLLSFLIQLLFIYADQSKVKTNKIDFQSMKTTCARQRKKGARNAYFKCKCLNGLRMTKKKSYKNKMCDIFVLTCGGRHTIINLCVHLLGVLSEVAVFISQGFFNILDAGD